MDLPNNFLTILKKKKPNNLSRELLIKSIMKNALFVLGLSLITSCVFGQLEINAELRPRAEVRHGYKTILAENTDAAALISQRTRFNLYYTHPKFKIGLSFQDVRLWGDEQVYNNTGVYGDNASLDMNEGWIEILAGKSNALKIGRQYWVYEDERILARRNWNQHSIKYDGLLYKFELKMIKIHVGLSLNNNSDSYFGNDYTIYNIIYVFDSVTQSIITLKEATSDNRIKTQNFLYINKKINDKLNFSFQAFATGFQKKGSASTVYIKGTYGLYAYYKPGKFSLKANGFYQNGTNVKGKKVSAYFLNVKGELKLDPFAVSVGCDYHSGQDAKKENNDYQNKDHFFDLFYGGRHQYYGYMDLFDNLSKSAASGGLVDIFAGLKYKITNNSTVALDYHYFSTQSNVSDPYNANAFLNKSLGSEFDLTFDVAIIPEIVITGGFSTMLPTTSMEKLQGFENGGTGMAYWGWCMITAKPTLFKSEK
jgi:hypothetical protein